MGDLKLYDLIRSFFSIVLLAEQVNGKIESAIEFSGRRDQVTLRVTNGYICGKMTDRLLLFCLLVFCSFKCQKGDKKCANSTQRSQSSNS